MHPEFIQLGPLDIRTYGVLVAAGFACGLWVAAWRARREQLPPQVIYDLGVWVILAGVLGAKLFYLVVYGDEFLAAWRAQGWSALRHGFVFFGGFLAAIASVIVYARVKRLPLWKLADVLAPSLALGHAFGRLGCFAQGCCFGRAGDLPWAVQFPAGHPTFPLSVHPTQLYEAAGNLLIFAGLSLGYRHKRYDGQVWWFYVLAYGLLRFANEWLRADYSSRYLDRFSDSQLIAAVMVVLASAVLLLRQKRTAQ